MNGEERERKQLESGCVAVIKEHPVTIASHEEKTENECTLKEPEEMSER